MIDGIDDFFFFFYNKIQLYALHTETYQNCSGTQCNNLLYYYYVVSILYSHMCYFQVLVKSGICYDSQIHQKYHF